MSGLSIITSRAGGTPPVEDICAGLEGCIAVHLADAGKRQVTKKKCKCRKKCECGCEGIGVPSGGA